MDLEIEEMTEASAEHRAEELHLLVSVSQSVVPVYRTWRNSLAANLPARVLQFEPAAGPGRTAIRLDAHGLAWAEAIFRAMSAYRGDGWIPVRIFFAGPVGLAAALGRQLNATGRILAMDYDVASGSYFQAFDFNA